MSRIARSIFPLACLSLLAACSPDYSPNTYSANAVQQANKVEAGIVIGYRQVMISTNGTVGAVSGGAAGGILGAQMGVTPLQNALGGVGGTAVGALVGTAVEHVATDTTGWEYIVRKHNGDLLSVTQREESPLPLGQKVLVITGAQARVIADYSIDPTPPPAAVKAEPPKPEPAKPVAPTPIIIINTPATGVLPTQVTVPDPNGGPPTVIPIPPNLIGTVPGSTAAAAAAAPVVKALIAPTPTPATTATEPATTEPETTSNVETVKTDAASTTGTSQSQPTNPNP